MKNSINVWIAKSGLTKKEVADKLGVSHVVLSRWANGHSIPSLKNVLKLAKLLGCTVDDLFSVDDVELF